MTPEWHGLSALSLIIRLYAGYLILRTGKFWQWPAFTVFCFWGIVPQIYWIATNGRAGETGMGWNWPIVYVGVAMRILITLEAIGLLLWLDLYLRGQRWVLTLSGALAMASLGMLAQVSAIGYVRMGCFTAALLAFFAWAWRLHPTLPWVRRHMIIMLVWLGSAAFASAAGSRAGDRWDLAATAIQAGTFVGWALLVRRKWVFDCSFI